MLLLPLLLVLLGLPKSGIPKEKEAASKLKCSAALATRCSLRKEGDQRPKDSGEGEEDAKESP